MACCRVPQNIVRPFLDFGVFLYRRSPSSEVYGKLAKGVFSKYPFGRREQGNDALISCLAYLAGYDNLPAFKVYVLFC